MNVLALAFRLELAACVLLGLWEHDWTLIAVGTLGWFAFPTVLRELRRA